MAEQVTNAPELTPVRPHHRFDEAALAAYLAGILADVTGRLEIRQFEGGQSNPTFRLQAGSRFFVLRKKPPGELLPSAHAVDREYRVMTALAASEVPVPRTYHLCEDAGVIGTPFFIMEWVEGRVFTDSRLPGLTAEERRLIIDHFYDVLAALHRVDYRAVGLETFGKPGNYYARQISRWSRQYLASKTEDIAEMERLMAWLPENIPESDETTLVHGDYRIGNCIIHPTEPRIAAVLDWELSTLGHPLADLAYCCQGYHADVAPGETLRGLDLAALGIPSEEEVLARYAERTGRTAITGWKFYMAFTLFRSACIVQGVYKRGLDGNASSDRSAMFEGFCRSRAEWAIKVLEGAGDG